MTTQELQLFEYYSELDPTTRHISISHLTDLANPDLRAEAIRRKIYDLSQILFLGLLSEEFSTTTLAKGSAKVQLEAYQTFLKNDESLQDKAKTWLVQQIDKMISVDVNIFFQQAQKGLKRLYISTDHDKRCILHLAFVGVYALDTSLLGSSLGTTMKVSAEHAKFEFLLVDAVITPEEWASDTEEVKKKLLSLNQK